MRPLRKIVLLSISVFWITLAQSKPLRVGLVLDKGGRDDKSFNASALRGATEAKKKFGIRLKTVTASDDTAIEPSLRTFAQRGFDLVMGIGFVQGDAIGRVAKEFPSTEFLVVDAEVHRKNVRSVLFNDHEGSYVVGVIAALTTKSNVVGFLGGMNIPLIKRFEMGYRAGVKSVNPKIKVLSNYVGSTSTAWRNPSKGKELGLSQFKRKADIIFAAAGASALGAFDAAEELNKYMIGVDSNQNWVKPGHVLTSMLKRVDNAVFQAVESKVKGKFQAGVVRMGIREGGIDFSVDKHNRKILKPDVEKKANAVKEQIVNGKIKVPDYFETLEKSKPKKNAGIGKNASENLFSAQS